PNVLGALEDDIDRLAREAGVPYEFADVRVPSGESLATRLGAGLRHIASQAGAARIVVPVESDSLSGKPPKWVADLASFQVLLVRPPVELVAPVGWPRRILVPVLREADPTSFDVAAAFSASEVAPQVDVVATRVIKMPAIVPMYSTYRADSLVDTSKELSFIDALRNRFRDLSANVLLVRDVGRDLVDFAEERDVDLVVIPATFAPGRRQGLLAKEDREIARRARCGVVLVLTPESQKG
ncbi:MAG: universal stress protein, partial [Thermoplasmata archaeon]|nr:universal stress protein [Thermoplasmata archaeon]